MKNDFVITIPSADRTYGDTFRLIKNTDIPVYVYVRSYQIDDYKKVNPSFNYVVIPKDDLGICQIRRFIQEHQHGLGNNILMLDDDLVGFERFVNPVGTDLSCRLITFDEMIRVFRETIPDYDVVSVIAWNRIVKFKYYMDGDYLPIISNVVYVSKRVFDVGVKYRDDVMSEDNSFSIDVHGSDKLRYKLLMYYVLLRNSDLDTHFDHEWRVNAMIDAYLHYGVCIRELFCDRDCYYVTLSRVGITLFNRNGLVYSKKLDGLLERIKADGKMLGSKLLNDLGWKPTGPYYEDIIR